MSECGVVEDRYGAEAPASVDGVDLRDGCPSCGASEPPVFTEVPAGYYTCDACGSTWAGRFEDASIVCYLEPNTSMEGSK